MAKLTARTSLALGLVGVLACALTLPALAATHTVTLSGGPPFQFTPNDLTIDQGDTVEWVWQSGGFHSVTNGTDPTDPGAGSLFDTSLTGAGQTFSFVFNDVGDVDYFCRPHFGFNMVGIIRVVATPTTHVVTLSGGPPFQFTPNDLTIQIDDFVRWEWQSGGFHSVTSGNNPTEPGAGSLFDENLTMAGATFTFQFTEAGDVPYFCRPHFSFSMTGIVRVEGATSTQEAPGRLAGLSLPAPNPFNPRTSMTLTLRQAGNVDLAVYDLAGRRVASLAKGPMSEGLHEIVWDGMDFHGRPVASGAYRTVLLVDGEEQSGARHSMTLVR